MKTSLIFVLAALLLGGTAIGAGAQTLTSDKPDYAPADTATLTGSGFAPGEEVVLQVHHADATPDSGADHVPWTVVADGDGNFVTTWHVCEDDCLGKTLLATADGQTSGLHAETTFTDALVNLTATLGTLTGGYTTLKGAFDAINAGTHKGVIAITITGNTTETASAVLNASGGTSSYSSITISPDAATLRTVVSSFTTPAGTPLINLNGASNVTIDGSFSGSGQYLRFRNSGPTAANQGPAIQFDAGANNDVLKNCIVEGSGTSQLRGTISLGTTGLTNHITISGNDIRDMTATRVGSPQNLIWGNSGTGNPANNISSITISNNNMHNFLFSAVNFGGWSNSGNMVGSNITISGNSLYDDAAVVDTRATFCAIGIGGAGDGHVVSGNYIGGKAPFCGGAAWPMATSLANGPFWGISVQASGAVVGSSIQGNTIQNITFGSNSFGFYAINTANGKFAIGTVTGNTIGHSTTAGSITFARGAVQSPVVIPINAGFGGANSSMDIRNNVIANLTGNSSVSSDPYLRGIALAPGLGTTGNCTVENNTLKNLSFPGNSGTGNNSMGIGMATAGGPPAVTYDIGGIAGNTLSGLTFGTSSGANYGIYVATGATTGQVVSNNSISGITGVMPLHGIDVTASSATGSMIQNNTLQGLTLNAAAAELDGIYVNGGTGTVQRNRVWGLANPLGGSSAPLRGVYQVAGTWTLANNEISLKNASNTNSLPIQGIAQFGSGAGNIFYNSVYVDGSQTTGTAANSFAFLRGSSGFTDVLKDNLFYNERTGNGSHYAIGSTVSGTWTSDYNAFVASNAAKLGQWVVTDEALGPWRTASGGDAASLGETAANVPSAQLFIDPANGVLDLKYTVCAVPPIVCNVGTPVAGQTTDFGGIDVRGTNPDIGADEIDAPPLLLASASAGTISCFGGTTTVTVSGSGGTPPYSGAGSFTVSAGPYSYTVTDAKGCKAPTSGNVPQPAALASSESHVNVLCYGNSTGSIDLSVSGGTSGYTYSWSPGGETSEDLSALAAGTYTVTVTDANGCATTKMVTITQPAAALALSESHVDVLCYGNSTGSIDLSVSGGTSGYTYSWSPGGATTEDLSALAAGTYTVTVTDANGCTASKSVTIAQPAAALASSESHVNVLCYGNSTGSIDLSVSGGTPGYSYSWSPGGATTEDLSALAAGTYTVTVTDANGCATTKMVTITQPAAALAVSVNSPTVCAGSSATLTAAVSGGTAGYMYLWSPGGATTSSISVSTAGTYTVAVTDANGCTKISSGILTVNPLPTATITGPVSGFLAAVNTVVNFTGTFTGNPGTHTFTWTFDNLSTLGTVAGSSGAVNTAYTFSNAGVYMVSLTVTDLCGTAAANTVGGMNAMVVIYDPNAGFVTGGGWINSPPGADSLDTSLTGRANFGFVSKYKKGANTPTGETEFEFKMGNLNFHSTSYDWLVVSSVFKAQYKGSGTINGVGDYGFILTSIDGQNTGGGGVDKFRIKIFKKNCTTSPCVIYDNQMGAADGGDPTTALGGGSIVIHTGGGAIVASHLAGGENPSLTAFPLEYALGQNVPNPFGQSTLIRFELPERSRVTLAVFDIAGRQVAMLTDGESEPGSHSVTWSGETSGGNMVGAGIYFVRMTASSLTNERRFSSLRKMVLVKR